MGHLLPVCREKHQNSHLNQRIWSPSFTVYICNQKGSYEAAVFCEGS